MGRYYFHLQSGGGTERDEVGIDLPDVEKAYLEACSAIPELAAEILRSGFDPMTYQILIANLAGDNLVSVPFSELLRGPRRMHYLDVV